MKTLLILATFLSLAFGHSTESFLKARLMKGYDCCTLPEGQTKVTIGFRPVDIGFCAHKQMLILNTWNTYRWTDARLSWDPAHYDNITELRFPHNKIWIPDLTVYSLKAKVEHLVDYQAIVYSTGMVLIVPSEVHKINCKPNYNNLPLGIQKCSFKIGSWHNGKSRLDLEYKKGSEMEHDFFNDQVEITNLDISYQEKYYDCCPDEPYPSLTVDLEFNQKMKYKDGQLMGAAAE